MWFQSRSFWHPKDTQFVKEYEDAFAVRDYGLAAISDGVSSAIFSRQWAQILTRSVADATPDLSDSEAFASWLAQARSEWVESIDLSSINYFQRQKLMQSGGAYATLLWLRLWPAENGAEPAEGLVQGYAIGDCCFFHVRDGMLVDKFPLETVEEFDADPMTICSRDRNRDHLLEFHAYEGTYRDGDLLILSSDALAKWVYQQLNADEAVDWECFWNMSPSQWTETVAELRELPSGRRMRVDDTTLVMLRITDACAAVEVDEDAENGSRAIVIPPDLESTEDYESGHSVDAVADNTAAVEEERAVVSNIAKDASNAHEATAVTAVTDEPDYGDVSEVHATDEDSLEEDDAAVPEQPASACETTSTDGDLVEEVEIADFNAENDAEDAVENVTRSEMTAVELSADCTEIQGATDGSTVSESGEDDSCPAANNPDGNLISTQGSGDSEPESPLSPDNADEMNDGTEPDTR